MDSFLLAHRINDFLYDIGCRFSPISIRDQMIRGFLASRRLLRGGHIGTNKPLLVVGAGVAGATSAIVSAEQGVPTTLIDRRMHPFRRQLASTRLISAAAYDWPADHWKENEFPWTGIDLPLKIPNGEAGPTAAIWREKLYESESHLPNLNIHLACELSSRKTLKEFNTKRNNDLVRVDFKGLKGAKLPAISNYAIVLGCTGPGKEKCYAIEGEFTGPAFWDPDSLDHNDYGLPEVPNRRIVLSGGGDGALQDFIRIVTKRRSPGEIFKSLPSFAQERLSLAVRTAENQFARSFLWNSAKFDCDLNRDLEKYYDSAVRSIVNPMTTEFDELKAALESVLRPDLEKLDLAFVHLCNHFSTCYGLNRALVLLLSAFIKEILRRDFIKPNTGVMRVWSETHDCKIQREKCSTSEHYVQLGKGYCADAQKGLKVIKDDSRVYDIVILRHGIKADDFFGEAPKSNHRQILPYFLQVDE